MIQIEINLLKLERGTHTGRVKVTRKGKTFWREQRIGRKEEPKPFISWKSGDPYPKEVKVGAIADMGKFGKYKIVEIVGGSVKCENGRYYGISDLVGIIPTKVEEKPTKVEEKPTKVEEKPTKEISEYKDAPGIKGSAPTYKSLPQTFLLNNNVVGQMAVFRKESRKSRNEVGGGINVVGGKMSISKMEIGTSGNIRITGKTKYGSYHTHPDPAADTFSMDDILGLVSVHPINLTMAHTVSSDNLWCAVSSAETREIVSKLSVKELIKVKERYRSMSSMASDGSDKEYRKFVKRFCDQYKIGLYVGKSNKTLEKYDGSW